MLDAVAEIQAFTRDLDLTEFCSDTKTLRAVQYEFVILGEAARSVPEDARSRFSSLPWSQIMGMRNVVAHQYRRVDPAVLWDTIQNDLPSPVLLLQQALSAES